MGLLGVWGAQGGQKKIQTWSCGISNRRGEVKRSNIIKFRLPCQFLGFLYQFLCAFLQIKYCKHIEQNFDSVAGVMTQGFGLGRAGWIKNFSVGIRDGTPSTAHSGSNLFSMY